MPLSKFRQMTKILCTVVQCFANRWRCPQECSINTCYPSSTRQCLEANGHHHFVSVEVKGHLYESPDVINLVLKYSCNFFVTMRESEIPR